MKAKINQVRFPSDVDDENESMIEFRDKHDQPIKDLTNINR